MGTNSSNNGVGIGGSDTVYALAMNGTNQLLVGGSFSYIDGGSISANNVASWDGNSWNSFGTGSDGQVTAITVNFGYSMFLGGGFTLSPDGFCTPNLVQGIKHKFFFVFFVSYFL